MRNLQKITVRLSSDEVVLADRTAKQMGVSRNRLLSAALAAFASETDQTRRLESLLDARMREQTDALAQALAAVDAAHAEQDQKLRDAIRGALNKVLVAVRVPVVQRALETVGSTGAAGDEE